MKHLFIINPHAGVCSHEKHIRRAIESLTTPIDYTIYVKQQRGDSRRIIKEFATKYILGTETGDAAWNKWVKEAERLGSEKLVAIFNEAQKEYDK